MTRNAKSLSRLTTRVDTSEILENEVEEVEPSYIFVQISQGMVEAPKGMKKRVALAMYIVSGYQISTKPEALSRKPKCSALRVLSCPCFSIHVRAES